jgi:4-carboxymuconolactone decarboxylase
MLKSNSLPMPAAEAAARVVAPGFEKYIQGPIADLWKRCELSIRDRSIVAFTALIARSQANDMPGYLALDSGVKPAELPEVITHLAFYSGLSNAMSAVRVAKDVFASRNIGADQLPAASPSFLPLDEATGADRAARIGRQFGAVAPGLVQYATDPLFRDVCCARACRRAIAA